MTTMNNTMINKTILIIAAHPDDEMLGVGGTVAKHVAAGDTVFSLILGEGVASRDMSVEDKERQLAELHDHAKKANAVLGVKEVFFELLPDNAFDKLPLLDVIKVVEKYVAKIKPNIIYTHWAHDLNIDHRMTFQSVITACRPYAHAVEAIYSFEIPSVTECQRDGNTFHPNVYHDVTAFLQKKLDALAHYTGEMRPFPHPRSSEGIRALATVRGMESNLHAAEAFELVREVKV